jgi:hypothetical protein
MLASSACSQLIGFSLGGVVNRDDAGREGIATGLLGDVNELMLNEDATGSRRRLVHVGPEHDVASNRVRKRPNIGR